MSNSGDCHSREEWERLLNRPLTPVEIEPLARHLEECDACAEAADIFLGRTVLAGVLHTQAPEAAPSHPLVERLIDRFRRLPDGAATEATGEFGDSSPGAPDGAGADETLGLSFLSPARGPGELGWLAHFRILKPLGEGGMGLVFLAEDSLLHRQAALKVMRPQFAANPTHRQRFLREARAAAAIDHDNIVSIYMVGEEKGVPFLAMKLLQGESLEGYLQRGGAVTPEQAARLGREVALGLAAAHARGLTHRDIKPANLWLEPTADSPDQSALGKVKLLDFGLARMRDDEHLTTPGLIVGTPAYMAPEQARCEAIDGRADLFSLGVVLYRLLTGRMPFRGKDAVSTLLAVASEAPPPVASLNPSVPPALAALVMRLLEKDSDRRPASAVEVARALAAVPEGGSATPMPDGALTADFPALPRPTPTPPRRRRRLLRIGLGAAAAAAAVLLAAGIVIRITTPDGKKLEVEVPDGSKITILPGEKPKPGKPVDEAWIKEVAALPPEGQIDAVEAKLKELNPGFTGKVRAETEIDGRWLAVTSLFIPTDQVEDISPVKGLPRLRRLRCQPAGADDGDRSGRLKDLTPLRGLPLERLQVGGNPGITDLRPLAGMKLTILAIHQTSVADLAPLRGMPLKTLICSRSKVTDLSPLAQAKLSSFFADDVAITDLTPFKGMPLWTVQIKNTAIQDLSVLRGMPVMHLHFDYDPWRDAELIRKPTLQTINGKPADEFRKQAAKDRAAFDKWCQEVAQLPVKRQADAVGAKLKELNPDFDGKVRGKIEDGKVRQLTVFTDHVTDISPVRALRDLRRLYCYPAAEWTGVGKLTNLRPLKDLPLDLLCVAGSPGLKDLTPLAGMKLKFLLIHRTGVSDLSAIKDLPLELLNCAQTGMRDLSPLGHMRLTSFGCWGTEVADLSALKGMPLTHLEINSTAIKDLSPLADMPLEVLQFDYDPKRDAALIRKPTLKTINGEPADEFRKESAGRGP